MAHDPKKVPDPSADCPRCHYFEQQELANRRQDRVMVPRYPGGIDQHKAAELLAKAFPQKQRTYG